MTLLVLEQLPAACCYDHDGPAKEKNKEDEERRRVMVDFFC